MRERLIELIAVARNDYYDYSDELRRNGIPVYESIEEYVANYLLANGVIVPPCKVGEKVFYVHNETVLPMVAKWIETNAHGWCVCCEYPPMSTFAHRFDDFGKTVFLTKEEAEQALKGGAE